MFRLNEFASIHWSRQLILNRKTAQVVIGFLPAFWLVMACSAQELEPRGWTHLPIDTNFIGVAYAYADSRITFDPVLRIEGAKRELHTWAARYIRTFELFERSARFEVTQAWQEGRWTGLLDGVPATASRQGWSDTVMRFAVNLVGAPPLAGREYAEYRAGTNVETLAGAALEVQLPTGEYSKSRLINLGTNRFIFRPQLGVVHNRGPWSFEATGSMWIFTDNNSFFNGNKLEQAHIYEFQAHAVHTGSSSLWLTLGAGFGVGGRSRINGVEKDDRRENLVWTAGAGYPLTPRLSLKATYIGNHNQTDIGTDSQIFTIGFSTLW